MNEITSHILELLRLEETHLSGQQISDELGISRTAVWKHVRQLRNAGYYIEASPRCGYRLRFSPDLPSGMEIRPLLHTDIIGKRIIFHTEVDSTNEVAMELAQEGESEGTVIIADYQSAGRGRLDRSWHSPSGMNLYVSVILRPPVTPFDAPQMSIVSVVAAVRAITRVVPGLDLGIKWPNDIITGGKKLSGILFDMKTDMDRVDYLIAGIGINVNMVQMDNSLDLKATSLKLETGKETSRPQLAAALLEELEKAYMHWLAKGLSVFLTFWEQKSVLIGRIVEVDAPAGRLCGRVKGLSCTGGLNLELDDGQSLEVLAGDVHITSIS